MGYVQPPYAKKSGTHVIPYPSLLKASDVAVEVIHLHNVTLKISTFVVFVRVTIYLLTGE